MHLFSKKYKYKDRMFAVIPSEETRLEELGLALCVLEEDEFFVRGLRFSVGSVQNFQYHIDTFQELIEKKKIEAVLDDASGKVNGKLPKFVLKSLKETYKKNLKES